MVLSCCACWRRRHSAGSAHLMAAVGRYFRKAASIESTIIIKFCCCASQTTDCSPFVSGKTLESPTYTTHVA